MPSPAFNCPNGHEAGHPGELGQCSPVRCADPNNKGAKSRGRPRKQVEAPAELTSELENKLAIARARHSIVGVQEAPKDADVEAITTKKLLDLTPVALAELEYQLMMGKDDARIKVALEVLDRAGFSKRQESGGGGPVIIINGSAPALPWAPKAKVIVEGSVVSEEDKKT
jgi:hypothetical protein